MRHRRNPDEDLRRLERAASQGDPVARVRLAHARRAAGLVRPPEHIRGSSDLIGVVRPTKGGKWWAALGLGGETNELGVFNTEAAAMAEVFDRSPAGDAATLLRARLGETGRDAYVREERNRQAAEVGLTANWMRRYGHVRVFSPLDRARGHAREYRDLIKLAQKRGHAKNAIVICGGMHDRTPEPYLVHRGCPWCGGQAYLGDLEDPPPGPREGWCDCACRPWCDARRAGRVTSRNPDDRTRDLERAWAAEGSPDAARAYIAALRRGNHKVSRWIDHLEALWDTEPGWDVTPRGLVRMLWLVSTKRLETDPRYRGVSGRVGAVMIPEGMEEGILYYANLEGPPPCLQCARTASGYPDYPNRHKHDTWAPFVGEPLVSIGQKNIRYANTPFSRPSYVVTSTHNAVSGGTSHKFSVPAPLVALWARAHGSDWIPQKLWERNPDEDMRELERAAASGDPFAELRLLERLTRTGRLPVLDEPLFFRLLIPGYMAHPSGIGIMQTEEISVSFNAANAVEFANMASPILADLQSRAAARPGPESYVSFVSLEVMGPHGEWNIVEGPATMKEGVRHSTLFMFGTQDQNELLWATREAWPAAVSTAQGGGTWA